jgi:hypothetical protein
MKRSTPFILLFVCLTLLTTVVWAAGQAKTPAKATSTAPAPGVALAATFSQITGVAISPLIGVSTVGAYTWFRTPSEQRGSLAWYCQPLYWVLGLLLVGVCACKDSLGTMLPPGLKKPLDVAETLENKISGLVAVGAFVPFSLETLTKLLGTTHGTAVISPLAAGGLAVIQIGTVDLSWLWAVLMMPLAAAIFGVVWVTSHAINVLILLSPWGAVDAVLKGARISLLGLLTLTASINPVVGAVLSLVIVIVAWLCAGWAFRLTIYGTLFCWDFFTLRRARFRPAANDNWMFTARKVDKVPQRTYGRLHRGEDGTLEFNYRPWLVLPPRRAVVPAAGLAVGRGAFFSSVIARSGDDETTMFLLPPRYRGHETELADLYKFNGVVAVGLRRAWAWLKEALGFGPKQPAAAASAG